MWLSPKLGPKFIMVYQGRVASVSNCDCLEWNIFLMIMSTCFKEDVLSTEKRKAGNRNKNKKTSFRSSFVLVGGGLTRHVLFSSRKFGEKIPILTHMFQMGRFNHPTHGAFSYDLQGALAYGAAERLAETALGVVGGQGGRVFQPAEIESQINMQIVSFEFSCVIRKSNHPRSCNSHCLFEMKSKWKFLEPILGIVRSRPQMNEFIE